MSCGQVRPKPGGLLFEAVGNATLGQIVWGHLDKDLVTRQNADAVLAHTASRVSNDFMIVLKLDPEHRVGQQLRHETGKL